MSENTKIEWADHTFNPWEGCQKVGPGCDHCYAEARNSRFNGGQPINWGPGAPRRRTSAANWQLPLKWNAQAERKGRRFRVFCASLADVFDNEVPAAWRADLFWLVMNTPNLDWLKLTKRIGNVTRILVSTADFIRGELDAQTERERGLQAGDIGRVGDRPRGENLAGQEADARSVDGWHEGDPMHEGAGRDRKAWQQLHASAGDDQRQAPLRCGSEAGLPSFQGEDSAGHHGEPRGRGEVEQPAEEPGTGDLQRAAAPRDQGVGGTTPRRAWVEAPKDAPDGSCGNGHASGPRVRRHGEDARGAKQHHAEGGLGHLSRSDLEALLAWVERWISGEPPPNVWLGATVVNQEEADRDIPKLLAVPARVRFLSVEPMLGPIDLSHACAQARWADPDGVECCAMPRQLDWVICGGESGRGARPMHPDWPRDLRDQCKAAGVPFLFKQWGEWHPACGDTSQARLAVCKHGGNSFRIEAGERARQFDLLDRIQMHRVGKKAAGRLLDGVEHNGFPA